MQRRLAAWLVATALLAGCSKPAPTPAPAPPPAPAPAPAIPVTNSAPYLPGEKHREALALMGDEKWAEARVVLRGLLAAEPANADAWNDLSLAETKLARYGDAVDSARQALKLQPDFVYAQYNLGWALLQTTAWREAKEPLEANSKALPDRPEPLHALGMWHERDGNQEQALTLYRKAAAMDYAPAKESVVHLTDQESRRAATHDATARFPQAPPFVIFSVMDGYMPEGVTRKIVQLMPVRFAEGQPPLWAALVFDQSRTAVEAKVEVFAADASGFLRDGYKGSCPVKGTGTEVPVELQIVPYEHGEHLLTKSPAGTFVCGFKGQNFQMLYWEKPAKVTSGGLDVGGQLLRFVPETSQYLPAAQAYKLLALISELRAAGMRLSTTEAVSAQVDVTGKPAQALAWNERGDDANQVMIAVKPDGEPTILHTPATHLTDVTAVGRVAVPGHTFLAVTTYLGGAASGHVLVLEYEQAKRSFRQVFHRISDSASFSDTEVYTTVKKYRPTGGFELYTTTHTWNEAKGTFVETKTERSDK